MAVICRYESQICIVQSVAKFHTVIRRSPLGVAHTHVLNCFLSLPSTTLAPHLMTE